MRKITLIEFDEKEIEVEEISRKHWDYIVYKSILFPDYYLKLIFGTVGLYERIFKLNKKEQDCLLSEKENEFAKVIRKYRKEK